MAQSAGRITTGLEGLDALLDGLIPGDNIVWVGDHEDVLSALEDVTRHPPTSAGGFLAPEHLNSYVVFFLRGGPDRASRCNSLVTTGMCLFSSRRSSGHSRSAQSTDRPVQEDPQYPPIGAQRRNPATSMVFGSTCRPKPPYRLAATTFPRIESQLITGWPAARLWAATELMYSNRRLRSGCWAPSTVLAVAWRL